LIVFTEYKTTLDYLVRRLRESYGDKAEAAVLELYGGMPPGARDAIKDAFNDDAHSVRVLIATDAASEGLNLQETARLLVHFDIPWNPARLEQRNGRLDRHGQARDVTVYHFVSEEQADLKFLGHVVEKIHTIREDLGSLGELFDSAFERRFRLGQDEQTITNDLDREVDAKRAQVDVPRTATLSEQEVEQVAELGRNLDLSAATLRATLETALGFNVGQPRLEGPDELGRLRLKLPIPPRWQSIVDQGLRLPARAGGLGAIPAIVFDPAAFVKEQDGRRVFRPRRDTALLHLGHPLFREALSLFARLRFPGGNASPPSRWITRLGTVPAGAEALILLTVEELATNELREPFHHWVRTLRLPVSGASLGPPSPYVAPAQEEPTHTASDAHVRQARDIWECVGLEARDAIKGYAADLSRTMKVALAAEGKRVAVLQTKTFDQRIREARSYGSEQSLEKLEKERTKLAKSVQQTAFAFEAHTQRDLEDRLFIVEDELARRRRNVDDHIRLLETERARIVERLIPRRFDLHGEVHVYPVTVESRLPQGRA
jgi:hypothetical protein